MYMAGRTRTASRPSRTRMSAAPYSAFGASSILVSSLMTPLTDGDASGRDAEMSPHAREAGRPLRMGARDQDLALFRHAPADRRRAVGVELGVEVVEQGDRGLRRLLAVD